ncbi:selenocysteine-specific translation elongation factor [Burkholderia multivorans]|uniref:selenocysteine-specific translation elongation factor n=1 Tax=Burkholderia multivorans TaxID=87883 RepID=UPI0020197C82|nr:selenocysteine-specific translation elongation factor [Burkholderia multivorans]MCO1373164.1 selenocysteine-specific translation elongation factor [Burkholderia multivorans]MCO1455579.1 selenocysteine-specific translation elongation factor [Burkholderia multivorans]MCO1470131.1 selenocysteine-specific translation elongation factor [Burkholderia multivorans]UQO20229.1 selenocysteine-specific translation elongation factor [Burkholderia multivorans]UQO83322.1 selenocysteine-specific translatio
MIVGTAGHIDHGKTTLVRALTGVDTDRLKEEKARGISIELGYAYTPLENGDVLGLIDVPGHEKLIHTMAAGACGIDFALLVIAADDGVMPQTREHVAILQLLGVAHGAIALTKCDRVEAARVAQVRDEIDGWLRDSTLAGAPIFETRATVADDPGVAALKRHLADAALAWRARRDDGLFRLAVDRVFTLAGQGTVVTGTAFAGRVKNGDTLAVTRTARDVRVRSIHAQNRPVDAGCAGERCALNLAGIDKADIERGDTVADARLAATSPRVDVELTLVDDAGLTLTHWSPLHVHLGTLHRVARVALLDGDTLAAGQRMRVQLVFDEPVFALPGDRFIVRNAQATRTVGGGRVLDPFGPARKRRTPARLAWLDALAAWLDARRLEPLLAQAPLGIARATLTHLTGFAPDVLPLPDDALSVGQRDRASNDGTVISRAHWRALQARAIDTLRAYHERMPDEQGLDAGRLRRMAVPLAGDTLWRALVDALVDGGELARSGPWLHLPSHTVNLDTRDEALAQQLLPLLHAGRFDPPWVRDMARDTGVAEDNVRTLLRKLARRGDVHQVVRDLFYHADVLRELARLVAHLVDSCGGAVDAATFRDATGLGRKRAIQILEFFDRVGYTRFHRDLHFLRTDSGWAGSHA